MCRLRSVLRSVQCFSTGSRVKSREAGRERRAMHQSSSKCCVRIALAASLSLWRRFLYVGFTAGCLHGPYTTVRRISSCILLARKRLSRSIAFLPGLGYLIANRHDSSDARSAVAMRQRRMVRDKKKRQGAPRAASFQCSCSLPTHFGKMRLYS